jgi:transcriptional regulator with XRE-family HTH domain
MASQPLSLLSEENVAVRVAWEMSVRGWSQERLAQEMTAVGCPMHQSSVSKIVNPPGGGRRRSISVDELIAFAKVFSVEIVELLLPLVVTHSDAARKLLLELAEAEQARADIDAEVARLQDRLRAISREESP